ncbi:Protein phosphatase 1 regulatory subunit 42, partial [Pseudolycoriella hygida]
MSSIEFIEKYEGTKSVYVRKNESKIDRFKKLTHLHLNGKRIDKIGDLSACIHLKVLYLHNNAIHKIESLTKLTQLTHLYLQWNQIERIENLNTLKCLRTLFLGNNRISRLENLEKLVNLEELHIERQRLNEGTEFVFDLGCLDLLSRKLRILNVTGLGLTNLDFLPTLQCLSELIAAENKFECPKELGESVRNIPVLRKVEFRGCPAQKDIHYKEKLIAKAPNI